MKKEYRIKSNEDFSSLVKLGKRIKRNEFHIYYLKSAYDHNRFGVSVSTKIGNAVTRNKVKRQLRAIMDDFNKSSTKQHDIIVVAKQGFLNNTFQVNKNALLESLKEIEK
ncbi:MAG: ribonuclease P protein component [Erysipelotrichaceae bacterium]|jgi:ribonuclease P protein component|nr:ribonuclease P protein component [Erysipelotrichaceae bacterium]